MRIMGGLCPCARVLQRHRHALHTPHCGKRQKTNLTKEKTKIKNK